MSETRRIKLTKRVSFSLAWCWSYMKRHRNSFYLTPCIVLRQIDPAFSVYNRVLAHHIIQFNWLYILFSIKIFIIDKLKDK